MLNLSLVVVDLNGCEFLSIFFLNNRPMNEHERSVTQTFSTLTCDQMVWFFSYYKFILFLRKTIINHSMFYFSSTTSIEVSLLMFLCFFCFSFFSRDGNV